MIFIDSSVWIDYFNGKSTSNTKKLDAFLGVHPLALGDLILTEVLQGFSNDKHYKTAKRLLTSLTVFNMLNTHIAIKSADNFRLLRKKGVAIRKTIDVLIATFCIQNSLPLLHSDKDFEPFHTYLNLKQA